MRAIVLVVLLAVVVASAESVVRDSTGEQAPDVSSYIPGLLSPPSFDGDYNPHMNVNSELSKEMNPILVEQLKLRKIIAKKAEAKKAAKKEVVKKKEEKVELPQAFDVADFKNMPTDKQLPGEIVRLRYAPGALPDLSEEALPRELLPPPNCPDEDAKNDVKLWNMITSKIGDTKASIVKYDKWLKGADLALKKVKKQVSLTKKNRAIIDNAIKTMTQQRRDIVKRLKTKKLTRELEAAEVKMKELQEYGAKLGATKSSLVEGTTTMKRRVGLLMDGMKELRSFGVDPEDE